MAATPKYSPEQIEIKFQECESIILDKMWKKCEKGKRLMRHLNFVECLNKLDSDTYAKIVKLATDQVARRFMGYQNLESIVLGYTKKKFDYRVVDTLPDTTDAARIVWNSEEISIEFARNWAKVFQDKYIREVSGLETKTQIRAFLVNIAHEFVHLLQHLYKTPDKDHGEAFYSMGGRLFGFTKHIFVTGDVFVFDDEFPLGKLPKSPKRMFEMGSLADSDSDLLSLPGSDDEQVELYNKK